MPAKPYPGLERVCGIPGKGGRGTLDPSPYGLALNALRAGVAKRRQNKWPRTSTENLLKVSYTQGFCLPVRGANAQRGVENLSDNHSLHCRELAERSRKLHTFRRPPRLNMS